MNPISVTITGRLGDDPHTFTTRDGTDGVELRLVIMRTSFGPTSVTCSGPTVDRLASCFGPTR